MHGVPIMQNCPYAVQQRRSSSARKVIFRARKETYQTLSSVPCFRCRVVCSDPGSLPSHEDIESRIEEYNRWADSMLDIDWPWHWLIEI